MKRNAQSNGTSLPPAPPRTELSRKLRIMLLDKDSKALAEAQRQLKDCAYSVIPCSCVSEASSKLSTNGVASFDLIIVDKASVSGKPAGLDKISAAGKSLPLVLMAPDRAEDTAQLMKQLGAVEFLPKPLQVSKLRNLLRQSTVRLKMSAAGKGSKAAATAKADSAHRTNSPGGESGSNASTSEQVKHDHLEFELETTSFDAFNISGPSELDAALGMTAVMTTDAPLETLLGAEELRALFDACPEHGLQESCSFDEFGRPKSSKKGRPSFEQDLVAPWAHEFDHTPSVGSVGGHSSATNGGAGAGMLPLNLQQPVMGHPAGQLPPLPPNAPGMVWGLPTTPLQIVPKPIPANVGAPSAPPVPVPVPVPPMGPWGPLGPMMMGAPAMLPPPMPGMPAMPPPPPGMFGPAGMMMPPGAPPMPFAPPPPPPLQPAAPSPSTSGAPPAAPPSLASTMKRAESAPAALPALPMPPMPGMPPMLPGMPPFPTPCDMGPVCAGGVMLPPIPTFREAGPPDLQMGPDGSGKGPQRPPLGLALKKSSSFADLISQHLRRQTAMAS